jgi:microcystin-dependent protein
MYGGEYSSLKYDDWLSCQGQELYSENYEDLFDVIQFRFYGRNKKNDKTEERGCVTQDARGVGCYYYFQLPDMNGRYPKSGNYVGYRAGNDEVWIEQWSLPYHTHNAVGCSEMATLSTPTPNSYFGIPNSNVLFLSFFSFDSNFLLT